ncbi:MULTISPECIES: Cof-type HAD-IIB family hydrolase [unclassified Streptococcus]|uniref:Cof-type HAD-IIB family hydrolase n=1 Tax=unclassified Streptococcus TaxID=2608887 RepID=UPI0010720417|nr:MULTISPECIES: Cof-type HAD-IIB family hydrolase [unclassified Streptococcus]MBF0787085.1 HAD family hydrolase [Streptococcus sp. 19428wC2_LYSM12]MCQ9211358.1 Cof-type HAD-IIB family hydrolase [Streptococcus sp. B01]MCQ9214670.1 Cof-type HAD-IIB family hydrolase [Streptococcus sp. O1]TFV05972.1 HAD family hydrolase [Streptococcus sp. LYSM12]
MQQSTIKLVAFDMDGTFLNSQNDYDRKRFARVWRQLHERGIRVVAISGNQYQQIKSFFPDVHDQMTIVSEVGSVIVENGQKIVEYHFELETVADLIALLAQKNLLHRCSISGLKALYFAQSAPEDFKKLITKHNYEWQEIEDLRSLPDDDFTILTLDVPEMDIRALVKDLNAIGKGRARAVSSGFNFIDIVQPDVNKGTALHFLAQRWQIEASEIMAFGDSDNDLEMLAYAEHSYAMLGSPESVCQAAKFQAPSNDTSGVLQVIEEVVLS